VPWSTADEGPHATSEVEEWTFSFWAADGTLGATVLLRLLPSERRCWYWSALARRDAPFLHLADWDVPLPRPGAGLTIRSAGLWADHVCEAPFQQWTVANEAYAVALDDPDDALGRAYGVATPIALDVEWYATGPPSAVAGGYEQRGEVHGTIELEDGRLELDGLPGHRSHRWGDDLAPPTAEPALAHLGLRAPARLPDGSVADLVLTADGWRSRVPRSPA
jgi:hypothetical protein